MLMLRLMFMLMLIDDAFYVDKLTLFCSAHRIILTSLTLMVFCQGLLLPRRRIHYDRSQGMNTQKQEFREAIKKKS